MRKFILALLLTPLMASAQEKLIKIIYSDPLQIQKFVTDQRDTTYLFANQNNTQGKVIAYFDSTFTKKALECSFINGRKNGEYKSWHRNGILKSVENFKDGIANGMVENWNVIGIKTFEANYANGVEDGYFRNWYGNGVLKKERFYNMGALEGFVKSFYVSGKKERLEFYDANFGEVDGTDSAWFENGNLGHVKHYRLGVKDGSHLVYYEEGGKKLEMLYKSDKLDGITTSWTPDGKIYHIITFQKNLPIKEERLYDNGVKAREVLFKTGTNIPAEWRYWNKKGEEISQKDAPTFEGDIFVQPNIPQKK